jgi:hypothetical protein
VASEWMLRVYILPFDNFEYIAQRLRDSTIPNAAFGDSHVAAVSDFNKDNFINMGLGATTIRRMASRVYYYFGKVKPGNVIIEADPHLFADYRLEPRGNYIPESYGDVRLRIFDEQHRSYMLSYWKRLIEQGALRAQSTNRPEQATTNEPVNKAIPETAPTMPAPTPKGEPGARGDPAGASAAPPHVSTTQVGEGKPIQTATAPVAQGEVNALPTGAADNKEDPVEAAKFAAFMDWEVGVHTPVGDFRARDEARIYAELLDFLIARGAKVCLVNFPVDRFYRQRADALPQFAAVRDFYKQVAAERRLPYVSFWNRFDDPAMFQNTDHVNLAGSAIVNREVRTACFGER